MLACIIMPFITLWSLIPAAPIFGVCGYVEYRLCLCVTEYKNAKRFCDYVCGKDTVVIDRIAKTFGWKVSKIYCVMDFCFKHNYLSEYMRMGESLVKRNGEIIKKAREMRVKKCSRCGGKAIYAVDEKSVCSYCGSLID